MVFKAGQSGNPVGRAKGSINRRTQLAKLLEPHAEMLVAKMIELALAGDVNALRLCIDRLIPKMQREATCIDLPTQLNQKNISKLKDDILRAALDGRISINDAERLTNLINDLNGKNISPASLSIITNDPIEASKIYQEIMMG